MLTRRERQALETRAEILTAARRLFVRDGYVATSIKAIAAEAQVAVQTIYSSIGSKAQVLTALVEVAREAADIARLDQVQVEATDPLEVMRAGTLLRRQLMEHAGDIIHLLMDAAPSSPEVNEVWQRTQQASRAGVMRAAQKIHELGGLRPDLTVERAADILGTVAHPRTILELRSRGWTFDEIEHWIREAAITLVLDGGLDADHTD